MSLIHESTEDILNFFRHPVKEKRDDITLYTDEESGFDLNKILKGSIENSRSALSSPSKDKEINSNRLPSLKNANSSSKKLQEQVRRMKNGIASNQTSPQKAGFSASSAGKSFNESTLDESIVRRIDEKIGGESAGARSAWERNMTDRAASHLVDDSDTEMIMKETHRLINSVPPNITSSKEGEQYIRLLGTSINQLASQLNQAKNENNKLKSEIARNDANRSLRESSIKELENDNYMLREKVANLQNELANKDSSPNSQLLQEKKLLREKLIKYKSQYEDECKKSESLATALAQSQRASASSSSPPAVSTVPPQNAASPSTAAALNRDKLAAIYNKLADILHCQHIDVSQIVSSRSHPNQSVSTANPTSSAPESSAPTARAPSDGANLKMLSLFESLLDNIQERPNSAPAAPAASDNAGTRAAVASASVSAPARSQPASVSPSDAPRNTVSHAPSRVSASQAELLDRVLTTMDLNNDLYFKVLKLLGHTRHTRPSTATAPAAATAAAPNAPPAARDPGAVRCGCCPQHPAPKPRCQRCSSRGSDATYVSAPESRPSQPSRADPPDFTASFAAAARDPPANDTINLMGEYKWSI